jgi:hypothetical protein
MKGKEVRVQEVEEAPLCNPVPKSCPLKFCFKQAFRGADGICCPRD